MSEVKIAPFGSFCLLHTASQRMRGLLGTDPSAAPVLLFPCRAIHTFGMRYPIDVAFVDSQGKVVRVFCGLAPGRMRSCRKAAFVLERPAKASPWFREQDSIQAVWG